MGTQYPASGLYPTQQASYPNYSIPEGSYAPAGMAGQIQNTSAGNPTLRIAGLIIALFGVLLMLSAVILFVIQQSGTI